jgi:putative tryptophan/tyrosine transport system substrate-binding protein
MKAWWVLCALVVAWPMAVPAAPARPRVVLIKSGTSPAFQAVTAGFMSEVSGATDEIVLPESGDADASLKKFADAKPSLVLALGERAAMAAKRVFTQTPVVFAMVPYYERFNLEGTNVTGIALTTSLQQAMTTLRGMSKKARRVGVLFDPRHSDKTVSDLKDALLGLGYQILAVEVTEPAKAAKALKATQGKVDALLLLSDPTVSDPVAMEAQVAHARAARLPLVGLSSSQVKEGALFSVGPNFIGLGEQAGRLANRILVEKVDPGAIAVVPPEAQELSLNMTSLRRLTGVCDVGMEALRLAAENRFTLRVYP